MPIMLNNYTECFFFSQAKEMKTKDDAVDERRVRKGKSILSASHSAAGDSQLTPEIIETLQVPTHTSKLYESFQCVRKMKQ